MIATAAPTRSSTISAPAALRSVDLAGSAGKLEAVLNEGAADAPFAALICHPHPKGGGTMHNKVVYHAMKALNEPAWGLALPVLRFNFRGTGRSAGEHDGRLESDDVLAAMEWLENEYKRPLVVAGFSFGAAMALKACCSHGESGAAARAIQAGDNGILPVGEREEHAAGTKAQGDSTAFPARLKSCPDTRLSRIPSAGRISVFCVAALGLPTQAEGRHYSYKFLGDCTIPKLFLSGDEDQYAPAAQLAQVADSAASPKQLLLIPGGDHFFQSQLEPMQQALSGWLKEQMR